MSCGARNCPYGDMPSVEHTVHPFDSFRLYGSLLDQKRGKTKARKFVRLPFWFLKGCLIALATPFPVLYNSVKSLVVIPWAEWSNRNRSGSPKKTNGDPLAAISDDERAFLDAAIYCSVIQDYNEEAKSHGQGFDIPKT